ncbi:MAG: Xaa-Pro peptidase family protein [Candidatus Kapaibacterium sp.]
MGFNRSNVNYSARVERARAAMKSSGVTHLLICPGSNLFYLTGINAMSSERLFLFVLPLEGRPILILPHLERLGAEEAATFFDLVTWTDQEGPNAAVTSSLKIGSSTPTIAVDDQLWSAFLLDLQSMFPTAHWKKASGIVGALRMRKSADEVATMKVAAAIADKTFTELIAQKFSGRTENEIMREIERLLLKNGQEKMQFGIVGSGPNGAKPHHNSGDRVIEAGDVIVLDFGGTFQGYQSDMTRMVVVRGANPDKDFEKVYNTVNAARAAAHAHAKPGVTTGSVDQAARSVIDAAGYGEYFVHRTGHGIGIDIHEEPFINTGVETVLEEGMAFSIEPGVYLAGRFGVRIEDVAVVTASGEENINLSSHEITYVD